MAFPITTLVKCMDIIAFIYFKCKPIQFTNVSSRSLVVLNDLIKSVPLCMQVGARVGNNKEVSKF